LEQAPKNIDSPAEAEAPAPQETLTRFNPLTGEETKRHASELTARGTPRKRVVTKTRQRLPLIAPKNAKELARNIAEAFFTDPDRVKRLLAHMEKRALSNDKVLIDIIDRISPKPRAEEGSGPVQVIINSPVLAKAKLKVKRNIDGTPVEDALDVTAQSQVVDVTEGSHE
jgi:hypothetical protein